MDDREILALFSARSETAIEETAAKYGRYCYRIAHSILQNAQDAEECVSDTYLRAWNAIPPAMPERLQTYLGKITRRLSLNAYDKRTADKRGGDSVVLCLEELEMCVPADRADSPLAETITLKDTLSRFLRDLPPRERRLFIKRYWYMQAVSEIAAADGLSENHVSVILMRTRKKLKTVLEKEEIAL